MQAHLLLPAQMGSAPSPVVITLRHSGVGIAWPKHPFCAPLKGYLELSSVQHVVYL